MIDLSNAISLIASDMRALKKNDPSVKSYLEAVLCSTPIWTIIAYRLMNPLQKMGIPIFPRFFMTLSKTVTGVEIHPSAEIGKSFFIDHGVGVVIGETTKIGENCVMFQNVTLGGTGKHKIKRHPTIGNNVLIGAGATLLGPIKVGDNVKIGAETFIMMRDVPSNCTVVGVPGIIVRMNGKKARKKLEKTAAQI
ncbi:MAG: serine O-acetyltransferase [Candidatus Diapherotrites archaeon]|nr:serine O-acetyltransferase [Candidatus Diapherotrites archaeon]